jgi:hypothetical protein
VVLAPDAWRQFVEILGARGPGDMSSLLPVPYIVRAVAGLILAVVAGRLRPSLGEPLLVVAVTVALPTLWFTALSLLVAIVPLVATPSSETEPAAADPAAAYTSSR